MPKEKKIPLRIQVKKILADTITPVSLYLKLRDRFDNPVLLESNDFRSAQNCYSIVGLEPIASFQVKTGVLRTQTPSQDFVEEKLSDPLVVASRLKEFISQFEITSEQTDTAVNGFFGHTSYDGVQYFDTLEFNPKKRRFDIPDIHYSLYRYVIVFDHFKEVLYLQENIHGGEKDTLDELEILINSQTFGTYPFQMDGKETSNLTDEEFKELVTIGKHHCQIGDVFQIVFSRQFEQAFKGDDFNVYRVLRSINPSPYLFYFDYGNYKIFGSSPEAQMVIQKQIASVNPIAGTYLRTGNDEEDALKAQELAKDPKENAEHIMLVDLARNDLGRHSEHVDVKELKEIQFFSHVIHLVSKVEGKLEKTTNPIQVFGDTFPAGTLSGAPKYKAIELINLYENQNRSYYGGAIGFIDFSGDMNQAIVIRSFMSRNNTLFYQAGAGIVAASKEESELQEVNNKLGALKKALQEAEKML